MLPYELLFELDLDLEVLGGNSFDKFPNRKSWFFEFSRGSIIQSLLNEVFSIRIFRNRLQFFATVFELSWFIKNLSF